MSARALLTEPSAWLRPGLNRFSVPVALFAGALSREYRFYSLLLARLQVEGVPFDVFNDVLLQDLAFEALQCVLQTFPVVNLYFSQRSSSFLIDCWSIQNSSLLLKLSTWMVQLSPHGIFTE
jgi:hypothetical protein